MTSRTLKEKRIFAFIVDFIILTILAVILGIIFEHIKFFSDMDGNWIGFFQPIFILFRDIAFKNRSIGKKIFGLSIIRKNGGTPKLKELILRNIIIVFIIPLELYKFFAQNEGTFGDVIAGTQVIDISTKQNNI